jgi:hypothetical protein
LCALQSFLSRACFATLSRALRVGSISDSTEAQLPQESYGTLSESQPLMSDPEMQRMPTSARYAPVDRTSTPVISPLRYHCKRWCSSIATVVAVVLTIMLLAGINAGVQMLHAPDDASFEALRPTLVTRSTDFGNIVTSRVSTKLLFLQFNSTFLTQAEPQLILFSATFASGSFDSDHTVSLLHFPAENTVETVFYFRLTEDLSGVDLYRKQLIMRTTDSSMKVSTAESAPDEWVITMPVVAIDAAATVTASDKSLPPQATITILADALLLNGFYVTDISEGVIKDFRMQLSTITAFPANADLTVEYELVSSNDLDHHQLELQTY